jgi:7-cyano-7-deazaguanine synthase in queuosine biosynthesis
MKPILCLIGLHQWKTTHASGLGYANSWWCFRDFKDTCSRCSKTRVRNERVNPLSSMEPLEFK